MKDKTNPPKQLGHDRTRREGFLFLSTAKPRITQPKPSISFYLDADQILFFSRSVSQLGCVQSLLPLHSAVSSARLTSCLSIDSRSSRSLSQVELKVIVSRSSIRLTTLATLIKFPETRILALRK